MAEQKEILESIRDALSGKDDVLDLTQMVNEDGSITEITPKYKEAAPVKIEPVLNVAKPEPAVEELPVAAPEVVAEPNDDILSEIDSILNHKAIDENVELEFAERQLAEITPQEFETAEEFEAAPAPIEPAPDGHIMPRAETEIIEGKHMDNENVSADDAKDSISELLGKLKNQGKEARKPDSVAPFRSGATMEDLVAEMLKPMMKDWLDNNLPKLVKETVQKEIQKLIPKE